VSICYQRLQTVLQTRQPRRLIFPHLPDARILKENCPCIILTSVRGRREATAEVVSPAVPRQRALQLAGAGRTTGSDDQQPHVETGTGR